jgi:hypothetical protein
MTISRNLSFLAEGASSTGVLGVANGGSAATTLTGYLIGNGTSAFTASSTIPTSALSGTISNAQLANSSLTVNGTSISLGGSGTVTAAAGTLTGTTLNSTVVTSSLTSVGTLISGTWNASTIGATYGGTGQNTVTTGDLLYGSATNTWSKLSIGSTGTILRVVGGIPSWGTDYTGTVTSVAASVPSFLSISGSPITTSGTFAITYSGTALPVANGGSGLTSLNSGYIPYGNGTSAFSSSSNLQFNGSTLSLGISPSSWSLLTGFDINTYGSVSAYSNQINVTGNAYYNGSSWVYKTTAPATMYTQSAGNSIWYYAVSGTAGNTFSFTQAMQIGPAGGVSIGNTTDPGAGNLLVNSGLLINSSSFAWTDNKSRVQGGTLFVQKTANVSTSTALVVSGVAGVFAIRDNNVGGTAVVLLDAVTGVTILGQQGSIFTTSAPSATQIQLGVTSSPNYGMTATAGSTRNGDQINIASLLCQ